jgi:hypothetical protein
MYYFILLLTIYLLTIASIYLSIELFFRPNKKSKIAVLNLSIHVSSLIHSIILLFILFYILISSI